MLEVFHLYETQQGLVDRPAIALDTHYHAWAAPDRAALGQRHIRRQQLCCTPDGQGCITGACTTVTQLQTMSNSPNHDLGGTVLLHTNDAAPSKLLLLTRNTGTSGPAHIRESKGQPGTYTSFQDLMRPASTLLVRCQAVLSTTSAAAVGLLTWRLQLLVGITKAQPPCRHSDIS